MMSGRSGIYNLDMHIFFFDDLKHCDPAISELYLQCEFVDSEGMTNA